MSNPEFHSCATCGYTWRHGQHGGHSCSQYLLEHIKELRHLLNEMLRHGDYATRQKALALLNKEMLNEKKPIHNCSTCSDAGPCGL